MPERTVLADLDELPARVGAQLGTSAWRTLDQATIDAPAGARVRGAVELTSAEAVSGGVQAVFRIAVELAGAPKPACVADLVIRFLR